MQRRNTCKHIANTNIRVSGLESEVAIVLDDMAIEYKRQVELETLDGIIVGVFDFLLADGRGLEVNGSFWHSDPREYPEGPQFASQKTGQESWDRKVAECNHQGVALVEVWERDFRRDTVGAVQRALNTGTSMRMG